MRLRAQIRAIVRHQSHTSTDVRASLSLRSGDLGGTDRVERGRRVRRVPGPGLGICRRCRRRNGVDGVADLLLAQGGADRVVGTLVISGVQVLVGGYRRRIPVPLCPPRACTAGLLTFVHVGKVMLCHHAEGARLERGTVIRDIDGGPVLGDVYPI